MSEQNCGSCSAPVRNEMKFCPGCGNFLENQVHSETSPVESDAQPIDSISSGLKENPNEKDTGPSVFTQGSQPEHLFGPISKKTWIVAAALGVATLVGLLAFEGANTAYENAINQNAELAAGACANIIGQHVPEVDSASIESHVASVERVRVKFRTSTNQVVGDIAQCEYSIDERVVYVENIEWTFDRNGVETDVVYDRKTNLVNFQRVPQPAPMAPSTATPSTSCETAFMRAAAVPLSRDNNAEIAQTTKSCSDVDEWWAMLKRYPDTFGVSGFLESEKGLYVGSACTVGAGSPVCRDANLRGIGF